MAFLNIKEKYLKKLRDNGYLGYSREGDKYWYTQEDIDRFLQRFHFSDFTSYSDLQPYFYAYLYYDCLQLAPISFIFVKIFEKMGESDSNIISLYILSVNRTIDIPAFYTEWFFNLIKRVLLMENPFNGKEYVISFENVRFMVFWSKNPTPLIPYLNILKSGINFYIQYTLNDYETEKFEPSVTPLKERVETFKYYSSKFGNDSVIWRFDPLILTDKIEVNDLINKIERIGDELHSFTIKFFNFANISNYSKIKKRLIQNNINYREWNKESMTQFAKRIKNLKEKKD